MYFWLIALLIIGIGATVFAILSASFLPFEYNNKERDTFLIVLAACLLLVQLVHFANHVNINRSLASKGREQGYMTAIFTYRGCRTAPFSGTHLPSSSSSSSSSYKKKPISENFISSPPSAQQQPYLLGTSQVDIAGTLQAQSKQLQLSQGHEDISEIQGGLVIYVSSFNKYSYPDGGGKIWINVGSTARGFGGLSDRKGVVADSEPSDKLSMKGSGVDSHVKKDKDAESVKMRTDAISGDSDRDFHFQRSPAFSRRDGFKMAHNVITGPYSFQMGIRGDMAFSIFMLCQFSGDLPSPDSEAVMFRLYANTPGNNGISMMVSDGAGEVSAKLPTSSIRMLRLRVQFGEDVSIECKTKEGKPLEIDREHKYVLVLSKSNNDKIGVHAIDVHSPQPAIVQLADERVGVEKASSVDFSNKDMTVNENGGWQAHLQAFGCYDRAISERDIVKLFDHYKALFEKFDPTYLRLMHTIADLEKFRHCPFNSKTCEVCRKDVLDGDWGNAQNLVTASEECRRAIGSFCAQNPKHPRCTCWSTDHPDYKTKCKTYRCLFGNPAECRSGPYPLLDAERTERAQPRTNEANGNGNEEDEKNEKHEQQEQDKVMESNSGDAPDFDTSDSLPKGRASDLRVPDKAAMKMMMAQILKEEQDELFGISEDPFNISREEKRPRKAQHKKKAKGEPSSYPSDRDKVKTRETEKNKMKDKDHYENRQQRKQKKERQVMEDQDLASIQKRLGQPVLEDQDDQKNGPFQDEGGEENGETHAQSLSRDKTLFSKLASWWNGTDDEPHIPDDDMRL